MAAYKKSVQEMIDNNQELFNKFKVIHDKYVVNPFLYQAEFNAIGGEVTEIVRDYERRLCRNMSTGKYGQFSANLSQKFWDELKKIYAKIDFIGVQ